MDRRANRTDHILWRHGSSDDKLSVPSGMSKFLYHVRWRRKRSQPRLSERLHNELHVRHGRAHHVGDGRERLRLCWHAEVLPLRCSVYPVAAPPLSGERVEQPPSADLWICL